MRRALVAASRAREVSLSPTKHSRAMSAPAALPTSLAARDSPLLTLQGALLDYLHRYWLPQYVIAFFVRTNRNNGSTHLVHHRRARRASSAAIKNAATLLSKHALQSHSQAAVSAADSSSDSDSFAALASRDASDDDDSVSVVTPVSHSTRAEAAQAITVADTTSPSLAGSPSRTEHSRTRRRRGSTGLRAASASAVRMSSARFRRHQERLPQSATGARGPVTLLAAAPGGTTAPSPLLRRRSRRGVGHKTATATAAEGSLAEASTTYNTAVQMQSLGSTRGRGECHAAAQPLQLGLSHRGLGHSLPRLATPAVHGKRGPAPSVPPGNLAAANAQTRSTQPGAGALAAEEEVHATLWPMWSTPPLACLDILAVPARAHRDAAALDATMAELSVAVTDPLSVKAVRQEAAAAAIDVVAVGAASVSSSVADGAEVLGMLRREVTPTPAEEAETMVLQDALLLDDLGGRPFEQALELGFTSTTRASPAVLALLGMVKAILAALSHEPMPPEQRRAAWMGLLRTYLLPTAAVSCRGSGGEGREKREKMCGTDRSKGEAGRFR